MPKIVKCTRELLEWLASEPPRWKLRKHRKWKNSKPTPTAEPRYTAKEITQAREWLIEVCSQFADRGCAGCPIGDPCDFCSVDGLNNVMRAWKEARAHENTGRNQGNP